jgi:hypothetical protein
MLVLSVGVYVLIPPRILCFAIHGEYIQSLNGCKIDLIQGMLVIFSFSVHKNPICTCIMLWWTFSFCCLIGFPVAFFWEQKMARVDCFSVDYRCQCFVFSLFFLETRANYLKFMDSTFSCEHLSVCFYFFDL